MAMTMSMRHCVGVLLVVVNAIVIANIFASRYLKPESRAILFRGQFVVLLETGIFIGCRYVWRCVQKALSETQGGPSPAFDREASKLFTSLCRTLTLVFLGLCLSTYPAGLLLVAEEPYVITLICFICLGIFIQLIFFVFVLNRLQDLIKYITHWTLPWKKYRTSLLLTISYLFFAVPFGVYFASQPPVIKFEQIPVDKLPEELDGFRIVHISDVHLGPTVGKYKFSRIVDMVNQQKPDAIVMVGDFVDAPTHKLAKATLPARRLSAKKGVYFVTGNHEYHTADVEAWFSHWRSLGVTVLHNGHVTIHSHRNTEAQFCLAGTDDIEAPKFGYDGHGMDLDTAIAGCNKKYPIILLAHQPKAAMMAMDSEHDIQLVLSGHTHGGQFFPMSVLAYLVNPFYAGLYQYRGGHIYVSQGTVYWGIPIRIGTQHEITVIILRSSSKLQ